MTPEVDVAAVSEIVVRPMVPEDKPQVRGVFRRSFPILQQVFFGWTPDVLVAERDGSILGAVMLKTYRLPGDQKGGFISWIFTAPEARGLGVGQRLTEGADCCCARLEAPAW